MPDEATKSGSESQSDKFKEPAEDHFCDPGEKRWDDRLRKVVTPKEATKDN